MTSALSTLPAHDAAGESRLIQFLDLSGTGAGPFISAHAVVDALGALLFVSGNPGHVTIDAAPGLATGIKQDAAQTTFASILTALGLLATDADVQAGTAKLEAMRALLAGTLAVSANTLPLPAGAATDAKVEAVRSLLAAALTVNLPTGAATDAKVEAVRALLAGTLSIGATSLPLPAGAAADATLQAILTKLGTARAETLWTDDTGAYFVRVDNAGAISWVDVSGNAASAPGTGARPAAGATVIMDKSSYQATAAATGYAIGDLIDHFVTTDPSSGAVIAHFWLNITTEAKLAAAPSSANVTLLSPLPAGGATSVLQGAGNAALTSIVTALAGTLAISASALPLPAGAATQTTLAAVLAALTGVLATERPPLTYTPVTGSPFTLTSAWAKVATTTGATKGLRIAPIASATTFDIEWVSVAAGGAAPTDTYGEPVQGGESWPAGLPIGDLYLKSATGQVAIVKTGA